MFFHPISSLGEAPYLQPQKVGGQKHPFPHFRLAQRNFSWLRSCWGRGGTGGGGGGGFRCDLFPGVGSQPPVVNIQTTWKRNQELKQKAYFSRQNNSKFTQASEGRYATIQRDEGRVLKGMAAYSYHAAPERKRVQMGVIVTGKKQKESGPSTTNDNT